MVLRPIYEYLQGCGDEYKILVLPDHPTPIETRTHSSEPIPFFLYSSAKKANGVPAFTEEAARQTGLYIPKGHHLLDMVIKNKTR